MIFFFIVPEKCHVSQKNFLERFYSTIATITLVFYEEKLRKIALVDFSCFSLWWKNLGYLGNSS